MCFVTFVPMLLGKHNFYFFFLYFLPINAFFDFFIFCVKLSIDHNNFNRIYSVNRYELVNTTHGLCYV